MEKKEISAVVITTLDMLALALADHGHHWSDDERHAYELAVSMLNENTITETVH